METQLVDYYVGNDRLYVATDQIIFGFDSGELKLLIYKRKFEPNIGQWSLIGSFVREDEDVEEAAVRVLREITGLEDVYLELSGVYGKTDRDDNGFRCISIAHYSLIRIGEYNKNLVEKHGAFWFPLNEVPSLIFDHDEMVQDALSLLRRKAKIRPIGFELLPEKFSIPQIRQLYEAIYQKEFDPPNFRKKVLSLGVLRKLNEKDMSGSKKGAYLYEFDYENYQRLIDSGFDFQL